MAYDGDRGAPVIEHVVEAGGAPLVRIVEGSGPVVAVALHDGHALRPGLARHLVLPEGERLREEDPFTSLMAPEPLTRITVLRSRFEIDLNRPRFRAVYQGPADAWGLNLYDGELPDELDRVSRACYDAFYSTAFDVLSRVADKHGRFVVLDLHSYNHRREGAHGASAPAAQNPEVNVGTKRLDRERWGPVVDRFIGTMVDGGFDCRENVKFGGGHFAHWVADTFPDRGAALAIEFKKTYMDEWTGVPDRPSIERIRNALVQASSAVASALDKVEVGDG